MLQRTCLGSLALLTATLFGCGTGYNGNTPVVGPDIAALCTPQIVSQEINDPARYEGLTTPAFNYDVKVDPQCPYPVRLTGWFFQLASPTANLKHWALDANGGELTYGEITDPSKEFSELNPNELFLNTSKEPHDPTPTVHMSLKMNTIGLAGSRFVGVKLVSFNYEIIGFSAQKTVANTKTGSLLASNQYDIVRFKR